MSVSLRRHDGFALLAALWVLVGVSVLLLTVAVAGREAAHAARNRIALNRARWRAADCLERARAVIGDALAAEEVHELRPGAASAWSDADHTLASSPLIPRECGLVARAAGTGVDVNHADVETLTRLFRAAGLSTFGADSLAAAIADWRDSDEQPRALGAERGWYAGRGDILPRNGPFADIRELARVRGWVASFDTLVDVDSARVPLDHAPVAVLASLPGMGVEAVATLQELRAKGVGVDLADLGPRLSPGARQSFEASFLTLAARVATEPDAWIVSAHAREGNPALVAVVELTLVRASGRVAVVRRRSWSE
jgi:type II secretory pathway component PulK